MQDHRINFATIRAYFFIASVCCFLVVGILPATASSEGLFQRTLKVTGNLNLDVTTGSGSIEVRVGSSDEVQISGRIRVTEWFGGNGAEKVKRLENDPPIQQNGNEIRIGRVNDPSLMQNVSISYELVVPAATTLRARTGSGNEDIQGILGSVDISSGSGRLKIASIGANVRADTGSGGIEINQVKGNVRAKTGSGTIRATEIAGGFEGSTGSGDLRLEQTASGSVRADTGSGTLDLTGLRGSLQATTGSGSIRADGAPTGSWNLRTGSGSIQLHFPSNASFDLNAHSSSGRVSVNFPMTAEVSNDKKDVRGKVGGGGVSVQVETGSGSIEIH